MLEAGTQGAAVLVRGESGTDKSALVLSAVADLEASSAATVEAIAVNLRRLPQTIHERPQLLGVVAYLEDISRLCGEVDEPVRTESRELGRGVTGTQHSTRRVRVMAPEDVRMLRAGQQLLLHTGTRPTLVSRPAVWNRRDVRAFTRGRRRAVPAEVTRPAWVRGR